MQKSILMLINGFGVERKGSTAVYSSKLMPNMDSMSKTAIFGSLSTPAGDLNNGYRLFSMTDKSKKKDDQVDELVYEKALGKNETIMKIANEVGPENKLHVFYIVETGLKFHQIKEMVKALNPGKDKKVYVHLIMTSTSTAQYDDIIKMINKLSFESGGYSKVGFVVGKNNLNSDDVLRAFYKEVGEHWNESVKKFEILKKEIVSPEAAGVFYINNGFALEPNDTLLFMNYETVEMERFYKDITKRELKKYSLYEMREGVENIFIREKKEENSFALTAQNFGISILVLTEQSRINDINFYLNGMKKIKSPNITFALNDVALFKDKDSVINLIEKSNYDGYILDFNIGLYNKMETIKSTLQTIDSIIKPISEAATEKDYTFIISSLYGMYAQVTEGVVPKVINFSEKVPCLFQSNTLPKNDYSMSGGTTYGLSQTFLTTICDEVRGNKLIHKLSKLDKLLSKKK